MAHVITVKLKQEKDFRFAIEFGADIPVLYGDETPPLRVCAVQVDLVQDY